MVLTHQQQQQHLSHLDRVGIVFQKYEVRFQKIQEWENRRGNPNKIKYQSYTGVWVSYTVKKPKKSWFWWMGLNYHYIPTHVPRSPSSTVWYWPNDGNFVRLTA